MDKKELTDRLYRRLNDSIDREDELNRLYENDKLTTADFEKELMWEKGFQHAIRSLIRDI